MVPDLLKAPDFLRNEVSALIPLFVPSMTGREIESVTRRMFRWCLYLGHSQSMSSLDCSVVLSHGQELSSPRWGMNPE